MKAELRGGGLQPRPDRLPRYPGDRDPSHKLCGIAVALVLTLLGPRLDAQPLTLRIDPDGLWVSLAASGGTWVLTGSADLDRWTPIAAFQAAKGAGWVTLTHEQPAAFFRVVPFTAEGLGGLVWVPPGLLVMGSPDQERDRQPDEGPLRQVRIRQGFWMGRYEVTAAEFFALMGENPSTAPSDSDRPIETVTWEQAQEYCRRLTQRERDLEHLPPPFEYRLPTEAEWEYACRAGTTTQYSFGDDPEHLRLPSFGWDGYTAGGKTHPVGQLSANPWGLHDMHGNVFEWCLDRYGPYPGGRVTDIRHPHIHRGGSWYCNPPYLRSASRHPDATLRSALIGFRVVLAGPPDTLLNPEPPAVAR